MKAILLPLIIGGAALLAGCETVAVVDRGPYHYRPGAVYYDSGRPYYYTSGVRYWGYPRGYSGARYSHVEVDREVTNNYYVDRRTVARRGDGDGVTYRRHRVDDRRDDRRDRVDYRRPQTTGVTKVQAQPKQQYTVKKKKVVHDDD